MPGDWTDIPLDDPSIYFYQRNIDSEPYGKYDPTANGGSGGIVTNVGYPDFGKGDFISDGQSIEFEFTYTADSTARTFWVYSMGPDPLQASYDVGPLWTLAQGDAGSETVGTVTIGPGLGQFDDALVDGDVFLVYESDRDGTLIGLRARITDTIEHDPPANDNLADAAQLFDGVTATVDAVAATTETGEDDVLGGDVKSAWWFIDADRDGVITFNPVGSSSPNVNIYTAATDTPGFGDLEFLTSVDAGDTLSVTAGTRYWVSMSQSVFDVINTYSIGFAYTLVAQPWVQPDDTVTVWGGPATGGDYAFPSSLDVIDAAFGTQRTYGAGFSGRFEFGRAVPGFVGYPGEDMDAIGCEWHWGRKIFSFDFLGGWPWTGTCPTGSDIDTRNRSVGGDGNVPGEATGNGNTVGIRFYATDVNVNGDESSAFLVAALQQWFNLHGAAAILGKEGDGQDGATYLPLVPDGSYIEWETDEPTILLAEVRPDEPADLNTDSDLPALNLYVSASLPNNADLNDTAVNDRFGVYASDDWGPRNGTWIGSDDGPESFDDQLVTDDWDSAHTREDVVTTGWAGGAGGSWHAVPDNMLSKAFAAEEEGVVGISGGLRATALVTQQLSDTLPDQFASFYGSLDNDTSLFRQQPVAAFRLTARPSRYRIVGPPGIPILRVVPRSANGSPYSPRVFGDRSMQASLRAAGATFS